MSEDTMQGAPAPAPPDGSAKASAKASAPEVEEAMRDVVDPELGINVVDLGLVMACTSTTRMWRRST